MRIESGVRRAEVAEKARRLREVFQRRGARAAVLSTRRNVAWLTSGADTHVVRAETAGVVTLVVTGDAIAAVTTAIEAPRIRDEELSGLDIDVLAIPWHDDTARAAAIRDVTNGAEALDDAALEGDLRPIRSLLLPGELDRIQEMGRDVGAAMTATFASLRPGEPEAVVANRLAVELAARDLAAPVLLAAADERVARYRHPIPSMRRVEERLMLVACPERAGLHVAITRFGWVRGHPDPEWRRRTAAAWVINDALHAATRPGGTLADALAAAISAYERVGFPDEWRLHHQGGTLGYAPRETIASPGAHVPIEPGMAFGWNPSITGTKVEDTLVLDAEGRTRIVTRDPDWPLDADGRPDVWIAG